MIGLGTIANVAAIIVGGGIGLLLKGRLKRKSEESLQKALGVCTIFIGACGLTIIGVLPIFFNGVFGARVSFGGTSLIIVVSVILETIKQIESQMLVRNYKGFLED